LKFYSDLDLNVSRLFGEEQMCHSKSTIDNSFHKKPKIMRLALLFILLFSAGISVTAQKAILKGTLTDARGGETLVSANVYVLEDEAGTITDENGAFEVAVTPGLVTVEFTYIGYQPLKKSYTLNPGQELALEISMEPIGITGEEVVVSGNRRPEKLTESPATIETIYAREIAEFASPNPGELLARQKGIDFVRAGVIGTGINIRGFNSNFNAKNLQVTDGRFSTLVATGLPFGPLNTVVKEDIERVEVILGPNSTMYGPNAHNGLVNTITKDPRTSEGTTVAATVGNQSLVSARFRHAQKINDRWAFKFNLERTSAKEFEYIDSIYIDRLDAEGNPGTDGSKEAYTELELDRGLEFTKAEAAVYYSLNDETDIIFNYGRSNSTYLSPTNVGRNQIKDWTINYYQLRMSGKNFFVQGYLTTSNTDSTYSIDDRTKAYWALRDAGLAHEQARGPQSYSTGALFQDASRRWNAEAQYFDTYLDGSLDVVVGGQLQYDQANSRGTYLLDTGLNDYINIAQYGAYAHLQQSLPGGFRLLAAARADYHEVYEFNFVPKFGLLKDFRSSTLRLTYGQGIAAPTILNMYGNLFNGLILGNAEGFTLADGTMIERQRVEKLQTIELGYKAQMMNRKLFVDANAYYNISEGFLSPLTVLGVASQRGDTPIEDVQDGFAFYNGLVASYINFGEFNTYGFDIGLNYYINDRWSVNANYSYFDYQIDENNLENDFNGDGVVNKLDILVNAPTHKANGGLSYSGTKFFGTAYFRWVQAYDYFSSFQIAAETQDLVYRGVPIVENARSADSFNYGPLGGFVTTDINFGYRLSETTTISAQVTNLFDVEMREFTAAPPTGRLYSVDFRMHFPID